MRRSLLAPIHVRVTLHQLRPGVPSIANRAILYAYDTRYKYYVQLYPITANLTRWSSQSQKIKMGQFS